MPGSVFGADRVMGPFNDERCGKFKSYHGKLLSEILERILVFCYQSKVNETGIFEVVSTDGSTAVGTHRKRIDALS